MSTSLSRPKDRISVLVVTADNMTSELLKDAFAHGRTGFKVDTLTGSSDKIIGQLGAHRADVALITKSSRTAPRRASRSFKRRARLKALPRSCSCRAPNPRGC